jgi:hypothetical protein
MTKDRKQQPRFVAGPAQRHIPAPLMNVLREQFPQLIHGVLEGEDVFLVMADKKGRPREAVHYRASAEFMTAVRVAESGVDNLLMLIGRSGFKMTLLAPEIDSDKDA